MIKKIWQGVAATKLQCHAKYTGKINQGPSYSSTYKRSIKTICFNTA